MIDFQWDKEKLELEIINPQHPTYVPFAANRCWSILPVGLEGYCYLVDTPSFTRIFKRMGFYLQIGQEQGSLVDILKDVKIFYGANYLRITGTTCGVELEIKVYPDQFESGFYFVVNTENLSKKNKEVSAFFAADFEFNPVTWGAYGFSEESRSTHTGSKPFKVPIDDQLKVFNDGRICVVEDVRDKGVGFLVADRSEFCCLSREEFDFDMPNFNINFSDNNASDDSFCLIKSFVSLNPMEKKSLVFFAGYQDEIKSTEILDKLSSFEKAFEDTSKFYQTPLVNGVKIETPDHLINAQFNLFNIFVKMAEHRTDGKHLFLPALHYNNWACPRDCFQAIQSYSFMDDLSILQDSIEYYRSLQCKNGRIPEGVPFWFKGHGSEEDRNTSPDIKNTNEYIYGVCKFLKFKRDKDYAENFFPSLKKAADAILDCKLDGLIITGSSYGFDRADWPGGFGESPQTYTSAQAYNALRLLIELAEWLGKENYAKRLKKEIEDLKKTINDKLWVQDRDYYRVGIPVGRVGKNVRDQELFYKDMLGIGNINVVEWEVPDQERAGKTLQSIIARLFTPYGMKFIDPSWVPFYDDGKCKYASGQVQQGGLWPLAINDLARAEIKYGFTEEAFKHFLELRLDRQYARFKTWDKGKELSFIYPMEWVDTDLSIPVTSGLFLVTSCTWSETLLEYILGIKIGFEEIKIKPALLPSWDYVNINNLKIDDSVWDIQIKGNGQVKEIKVDGKRTEKIKIESGRHKIEVLSC